MSYDRVCRRDDDGRGSSGARAVAETAWLMGGGNLSQSIPAPYVAQYDTYAETSVADGCGWRTDLLFCFNVYKEIKKHIG